jgi:PhnB protein
MLADGYPEAGVEEPARDRLPTYSMNLYLPDVEATVAAAEPAGATIESPPADAFYGSRTATIVDPYGVRWMLATHLHRVSDDHVAAARADFAGN